MKAAVPSRWADGCRTVLLALAIAALCLNASWWTITSCAVASGLVLYGWRLTWTQRRAALEELARLQARITELGNLQGRFVGNIAHEIKTPLAVVLGEANLLLQTLDDPKELRRLASRMAAEVRHVSDLVEGLLRLAHPFAIEDTASHESVFVGDVVIAAVGRCRVLGEKLGVRILTVLGPPDNGDPTAEVLGDALLLEVMVENLLRNALRFSQTGGEVELRTHATADSVSIVVRDHGIGIPPELRASVFDWFFERPGRADQIMSCGLGLAIVKRVVDHHGGTITLRTAEGGGSEFELALRRWRPAGRPPPGTVSGFGRVPHGVRAG